MDKVWGCGEISPFSDFVFYFFCFSFLILFSMLFSLKKINKKKSIKHIDIVFLDLIH